MPKRGKRKGSGKTALQESSAAATAMPAKSAVNESVKTASTASPTEGEIAALAYQLWLDNGSPVGSEQEYWFRAEAMLVNGLVAKREDLSRPPSMPRCDNRTESETVADLRWEGHWEVWEMESSGGARWVWDDPTPGAIAGASQPRQRPRRSAQKASAGHDY